MDRAWGARRSLRPRYASGFAAGSLLILALRRRLRHVASQLVLAPWLGARHVPGTDAVPGPARAADRTSGRMRRASSDAAAGADSRIDRRRDDGSRFGARMLDVPEPNGRTMDVMADTKKKVRVVVADDHPLYREGVVRALTASGRVDVVAQSEDGREALDQIREHAPDVALIDYKLPDLDGVSVVHAVTRDGLADARPPALGVHRQRARLRGAPDRGLRLPPEGGEARRDRRRRPRVLARRDRAPVRS